MMGTAHLSQELFAFLRELRENNNREWFQANKSRYEAHVRDPLLRFIADFGLRLPEISPHYVADPRPVGGSLFRIYRDVRFSKDKSPYKTAAAVQFRHEMGKDVHAPGFYFHLEPDEVFFGTGIWRPDTASLTKIRDAIVADPAGWQQLISGDDFRSLFTVEGESLKRPPKGYDPDHPLIEDLKRKDFIASTRLNEGMVCEPDFLDHFTDLCRRAAPFTAFLTTAVGLPW